MVTRKHGYEVNHVTVPVPAADEVVVRNLLIGINPVDWKSVEYGFGIHGYPWINGRESVGVVVAVGEGTKRFRVGSRVLLVSTNYRDLRTSTFQEFSVSPENLAVDIGAMEFGRAIGFGVPLVTAVVAMDEFEITESPYLLIWGGASCTGVFLCQLAKRRGFRVISVTSQRSEKYVRSFGADIVLDRRKIHSYQDILDSATGPIVYGIDCIGRDSASVVLQVLEDSDSQLKPQMVCLNASLTSTTIPVSSVNLKKVHENQDYGRQVTVQVQNLIPKLKPPKMHYFNGLENIPHGLHNVKQGSPGKTVVGIEYIY